jgi:hypothetical protein
MVDQKEPFFDWTLWLQWLVVTALGWVLGGVLLPELALVAAGLMIGTLQWVVLRQRIPQTAWWILASVVGWAGGWAIVIALVPPEVGFLTGTVLGAAMGTLQWLFLRQHFHQAGWWIVISALAWTFGLTGLTGQLLVGAVVGAVTGIALELLLRYPGLMKTQA